MASSASDSAASTSDPGPHQPRSFTFPSRSFGKKTVVSRSFQSKWFDKYKWLHYDEAMDAAYCYTCRKADEQNKLKSKYKDSAFISRGFTNWKDGTVGFAKHEGSDCHKEAIQVMEVLPRTTHNVGEQLSQIYATNKRINRSILLKILQNVMYLARQSIAFRGDGDEADSNFIQLLHLRACDDPRVKDWLKKKANKYTSPEIQNEILEVMALEVIRKLASQLQQSKFFAIMTDECTDSANREQLVICFRWVDLDLEVHEEFFGLYQVSDIAANTIVSVITDTLLRMNVTFSRCRGQCYDGAKNMAGGRGGVSKQIMDKEKRALFSHCYGHSLNLAASDAIKNCKIMADALDTAFEISKLIKYSPKRNAMFDNLKKDLAPDSPGFRVLCPTRWTVRGKSLKSILDNYAVLQEQFDLCLESRLEPDIKSRIIGVKHQMSTFEFFVGVVIGERVLKHTDNLSKTLQHKDLSANEGQEVADLSVKTLERMRDEQSFELFWTMVQELASKYDVGEPTLPRRRKAPRRLEIGLSDAEHPSSPQEHYRRIYYEALDLVINAIKNRFNQPGYVMYKNLETLLLSAANGKEFEEHFKTTTEFYGTDFTPTILKAQLEILATHFQAAGGNVSFKDIKAYFQGLSVPACSLFSEVITLMQLILVLPATNATSERSFSAMRRVKTYLRSTTGQQRLNHLMTLHVHKSETDSLDLIQIANAFVSRNDHREQVFGTFSCEDLL